MIEFKITIASFDVYPNSTVKPSALQRYMQQAAREDCDNMGVTYPAMRAANMVFVMTKLGLDFYSPIFAHDEITLKTYNNRISGVTFEREFEFFREGKKVAHATTQWVIVKYDDRRIVRPKDFPFEIPAHNYETASIDLPRALVGENILGESERVVRLSDLDENDHLNNCVYSDIAMDIIPFDRKNNYVSSVRVIFRQEARIDHTLKLTLSAEENGYIVCAANATEDKPCFDSKYTLGEF